MKTKIMMYSRFLLLPFLSSFALVFITGLTRSYLDFSISSLLGFILYFIITIFFLRKSINYFHPVIILSALIAGLFIIQLPIRIIDFKNTLVSLPDFLMHFSGIICGYIFHRYNRIIGAAVTILMFIIVLFMCFCGYEMWINKINYGTFTGITSESFPECNFLNANNDTVTSHEFRNKVVVLDFWSTRCGVCFRKFPKVQKLYNKYKNDSTIGIYAVNIPVKMDSCGDAARILQKFNLTIPLFVIHDENILKKLNIHAVPEVMVVVNGNQIIYRGDIDNVEKVLKR